MEVGKGELYNKGWKNQVCDLDAASNSIISQFVMLDSDNQNCGCFQAAAGAPVIPLPSNIPNIPNAQIPPIRNG